MTDDPYPAHRLPVTLTTAQASLYRTDAEFKQGVDQFLRFVVPMFLRGLEEVSQEIRDRRNVMLDAALRGSVLQLSEEERRRLLLETGRQQDDVGRGSDDLGGHQGG